MSGGDALWLLAEYANHWGEGPQSRVYMLGHLMAY